MVSLFTGLCTAAGLRSGDQPKESRPRAQTRKQALPKTIAALKRSTGSKARNTSEFGGVPPALAGLLTSLPPDGGSWTAVEREKFKTAFASLLDFCFEIKDDEGGDE